MNGDNHLNGRTVALPTDVAADAIQATRGLPYPARPGIPAVRGGTVE